MSTLLTRAIEKARSIATGTGARLAVFGRGNAVSGHIRHLRQLRKRFDPLAAAQRDAVIAAKNSETTGRQRYEHDAVVGFQREMDRLKASVEREMRTIDIRIKRVMSVPTLDENAILTGVQERERATFNMWKERLKRAKLGAMQNKRAMNVFRRQNRIIRDVEHPNRTVAFIGIIALAMIEMFLNYNYLVPTGVQAASEILVFVFSTALINVAIGLASGYFGVRHINHRDKRIKVGGVAVILFLLVGAIFLHCTLANYRHAIDVARSTQADPALLLKALQKVGSGIAENFWQNLFSFVTDINAIIVFCYGMIFNFIVTWEGASLLDDPYPGLGKRDRAWRKANERSTAAESGFREDINSVITEVKTDIDSTVRDGQTRMREVKTCIDDAVRLARQFEDGATIIENTLARMIADYWLEFRAVRETEAVPDWVDDHPGLNREVSFELDDLVQVEEKEGANFQALYDVGEEIKSRLTVEQAALVSRVTAYFEAVEMESRTEDAQLAGLVGANEFPGAS